MTGRLDMAGTSPADPGGLPLNARDRHANRLALAWKSYDLRRLDEAIRLATEACALAPGMPESLAALGWFLLESGRREEAESVLLSAMAGGPDYGVAYWYLGVLRMRQDRLDEARDFLARALQIDPHLDEAAVALAWVLHDMGCLVDATIWARRALSRQSQPDREELLGWLLLRQQRFGDALGPLQSALSSRPERIRLRCHLATTLQALGEADAAIELLRDGLAPSPDDPELLVALGWLHYGRGEVEQARHVAERLVRKHRQLVAGWYLLGVIRHECGEHQQAERCFAEVEARDESQVDALLRRARILQQTGRPAEALGVLRKAQHHAPGHRDVMAALVHGLMSLNQTEEARRQAHHLLRDSPRDGLLWLLLTQVLLKAGRREVAKRALRRALRLAPDESEIWRVATWAALEDEDHALARESMRRLMELAPNDSRNDILAAFVLESGGELAAASTYAERAIARSPETADAWRALAKVRHHQRRLRDAESLLMTARDLDPESVDIDRQLGWLFVSDGRLDDAEAEFARVVRKDPANPTGWLEVAEVRHRAGRFRAALDALKETSNLRPNWPQALLLKAHILADWGQEQANEAASISAQLLRIHQQEHQASLLLLRLAASGSDVALDSLRLIGRRERERFYEEGLETAQGARGNRLLRRLAALGANDFPQSLALATAAFFVSGLDEANTGADIARRARKWSRQFALSVGSNSIGHMPPRHDRTKLRVAYVAAHFHRSLLAPVLVAHDPSKVEVFLYTDAPRKVLGALGPHVVILPLRGHDLAVSMAANRIDVAVDTMGIHPFLGQNEVLKYFAMRIAPVQCAWLGSWASGGGVFDMLIGDQESLPLANESYYQEDIVRVPGGQWCWQPPVISPDAGQAPFLTKGYLTLGSSVRGLRLTRRTLVAWGALLARLPGACLALLGDHGQDWGFRDEFSTILVSLDVDPGRVDYRPRRAYEEYLEYYRDIDIALDAFPSNGGLCLIDALWMGVPFVSNAGTLLGERQGLSLLAAVGHPEWAAHSDREYVEIVIGLAADAATLIRLRAGLRQEVLSSPLIDGRRVAESLEKAYRRQLKEAGEIAAAPSPKERVRALSGRQFSIWHEKQSRLDFSPPEAWGEAVPDVSVVMVLFNQVGLSWQALSALADQDGTSFEVIVVDNASSDATEDLLQRLDGACVERNETNIGFLRAANQGAARARGRYVLFLNSDAVVHAGALRYAVGRLDAEAEVGALGGRIVLGDGRLQEAGCIVYRDGATLGYGRGTDPLSPQFAFERDVDFCSGAFLMVRRELWQRLGGFDVAYAPAYYEDADLCLRIRSVGYRVVYEPRVWISHFEWGSATSGNEVLGLMERNRQRFSSIYRDRLSSRPLVAYARQENDRWLAQWRRRVLVVDNAVPHMAIGGGLPRARALLHALHGFDVTLYPLWTLDEDWREVYASIPAAVEVMLGRGANGLERFLEERVGVYDSIVVSRPPNMAFVDALWARRPELFKGMRLIYDAESVFALREIGQAKVHGRPLPRTEAARRYAAELTLARRASVVFAVSRREVACFRRAGKDDVRVLVHSVPTRVQVPPMWGRNGFLFVGALYPDTPNEDGLLWLAREVLPRLKELLPDMPTLEIVGDCRSEKIAAMAGEQIRLLGRVDDPTPFYDRSRVFVAPARFAAGVPLKVIEAACGGIPVVASSLLVRQLGWSPDAEIISAHDAFAFADAMARLYCDEELWTRIQAGARCRTRAEVGAGQFERTLREAL